MGIFTPLYLRGDLSVRQAQKAIGMVKAMTDPQKLSIVARDGKDHSVRIAAIERLKDLPLLSDLALNDPEAWRWALDRLVKLGDEGTLAEVVSHHSALDKEMVDRAMDVIHEQPLLEQIAKSAPYDYARVHAIERLESQSALTAIARGDASVWARARATTRLESASELAKIAERDADPSVRQAAVQNPNMTDARALARVALGDKDKDVRRAAVNCDRLTDSHVLTQVALGDEDSIARHFAAHNPNLYDQDDLKKLLAESKDSDVRNAAIGRLEDVDLLASIARKNGKGIESVSAVRNPHLADQVLLAQVAIEDQWGKVGEICVKERVTDPVLLGKIALEAVSGNVRQLAVKHAYFNDAALLEQVAMKDTDAAVRTAAVENTALSQPDALERIAATKRDDGFLEPRWTAALKLSRRDPDRAAPLLIELINDDSASGRTWLFNETVEFLYKYNQKTRDDERRQAIEPILKRAGRI